MTIVMCRLTLSICFICQNGPITTIPCAKRTEESSMITLGQPTECINFNRFVFSFHHRCMCELGFPFATIDKINDMFGFMMWPLAMKMRTCSNYSVTITESKHPINAPGAPEDENVIKIWSPDELGDEIHPYIAKSNMMYTWLKIVGESSDAAMYEGMMKVKHQYESINKSDCETEHEPMLSVSPVV